MMSAAKRKHSESSVVSDKISNPTYLVNLMPVKLPSRFEDTLNVIHIPDRKEILTFYLLNYKGV